MKTQRNERTQEKTERKNEREEARKYGTQRSFVEVFDPMYGGRAVVELSPLPLI